MLLNRSCWTALLLLNSSCGKDVKKFLVEELLDEVEELLDVVEELLDEVEELLDVVDVAWSRCLSLW